MFRDRTDAGRQLAAAVLRLAPADPVVLALPRGGVPVALEVARALQAPLDLLLVRKIGAPNACELAVAAVAEGGALAINEEGLRVTGTSRDYVEQEAKRQMQEIERRRRLYMGSRAPVDVQGRTAVVVDDGIATGATLRAALLLLRKRHPARVVLAVPVAPRNSLRALRPLVDDVVCLETPVPFNAVGAHYADFGQVEDEAVVELLAAAA